MSTVANLPAPKPPLQSRTLKTLILASHSLLLLLLAKLLSLTIVLAPRTHVSALLPPDRTALHWASHTTTLGVGLRVLSALRSLQIARSSGMVFMLRGSPVVSEMAHNAAR